MEPTNDRDYLLRRRRETLFGGKSTCSCHQVQRPVQCPCFQVSSVGLAESGWSLPRAGYVLIDQNWVPVGIDQHQACGS